MGSFNICLIGGGKMAESRATEGIHWHVRLIGGNTVDLRDAEFPDQPVTIISVSLIGGDKILVPRGLAVETSGVVLLGGSTVKVSARQMGPPRAKLRVIAVALIGGATVVSDWNDEDEEFEKGGESRRALKGDTLGEVDALREEVADLAERLDFTERLLARGRDEPR